MKTIKCQIENCGNSFQSIAHNVRYCINCRPDIAKIKRKLKREKNKKTCPVCLEFFVPINSTRKYCYMGDCADFAQKVKRGHYERAYRAGKSWERMQNM